jgi:integral membrane sensor domain MASE1
MRYALQFIAVVAVYFASGRLGLDLAHATASVTAIWPPTGIALAALLLGGMRLWPAVALGALLTNALTEVPAVTLGLITAGNTLEACVGAHLLRRVRFRTTLERLRDVLALVGLAALLSTLVSATIGSAGLLLGGEIEWGSAASVWRTWWLGDMGGDLIVAPALLVAARLRVSPRPPGAAVEGIALVVTAVVVSVVVFSATTTLVYLVFPVLVWAALRFWQPGAVAVSLIAAVIAVVFTADGEGPFAMTADPDERLLLAQTFVAVAAITGLVLAAVTSERRRAENAMSEIAVTLQESLLPPALPSLPAVEAAAYFRPAGRGQLVGGDFYDVFQVDERTWAVAVGDVCGKGAPAAALTALARYTLRAAGVGGERPARVLSTLNESVRRESSRLDLCTAVFARLELNGSAPRVTLASAGHPLPLRLAADGGVEELGRHGMLLGADAEPPLPEQTIQLHAGETVIFYTDGLIDAYAPDRPVAPEELERVLAPCAGQGPADVIAAIERALLGDVDAEPRDDIAIVVLRMR